MYGRVGLDPTLLPWSWAEHRLGTARNYWIATTRPDGRPHTRPVSGIWLDGAFYFSTGSLAAVNLDTNPELTVHLESGAEVLIIEATAGVLDEQQLQQRIMRAYNDKYHWDLDPDQAQRWYEVRPKTAFGWIVDDSGRDKGSCFHGTVTRWRWRYSDAPTGAHRPPSSPDDT
jgi:hypothetical protein